MLNDDDLNDVSGGAKYMGSGYTINGFTYTEVRKIVDQFKMISSVYDAIRFCNNNVYRDMGWERLKTEDSRDVCISMFEKHFQSHQS